jgi:hypothetical protein
MKKPSASQSERPPLSKSEMKLLYRHNPTPELARVLWEVDRMRRRLEFISKQYIELMRLWPRCGDGRPVLLEALKRDILHEVNESWPEPRMVIEPFVMKQPAPLTLEKAEAARQRLKMDMAKFGSPMPPVKVQKLVMPPDDR